MNKNQNKVIEKIEQTPPKTNELFVSENLSDGTKSLVSKYNSCFQPKKEEIKKEVPKIKHKIEEIIQNTITVKQPIENSMVKNIKNEEISKSPFKNPIQISTLGEKAQVFISKPQEKVVTNLSSLLDSNAFKEKLEEFNNALDKKEASQVFISKSQEKVVNPNAFKEKLEEFNKDIDKKGASTLMPSTETKVSVKEMSKNLSMMNIRFGNYPRPEKPKPLPEEKTVGLNPENTNEKKENAPLINDDYNNVFPFLFNFSFLMDFFRLLWIEEG